MKFIVFNINFPMQYLVQSYRVKYHKHRINLTRSQLGWIYQLCKLSHDGRNSILCRINRAATCYHIYYWRVQIEPSGPIQCESGGAGIDDKCLASTDEAPPKASLCQDANESPTFAAGFHLKSMAEKYRRTIWKIPWNLPCCSLCRS